MSEFELIKAASGDVNLVYKGIALHCNNNPQQEAMEEFSKIKSPDHKNIIIIAGLGLGYLLKRVYISSKSKIVVYEPEKNISDFTMAAVDLKEELESSRVFITATMEELNNTLANIYGFNDNISVLKLKSSDLLYPDLINNLLFELPAIKSSLQSNFTTLFDKSWVWFQNALFKFREDNTALTLNILEDKFKEKAALIVSAGPSLDKNIETIRQNRGNFIIFCVNVAYKKLVSAGIIPDFTFYIDSGNYLYTIKDYDHSKTNIITHSVAYFKVLDELKPNKIFTFYCKNDLFSRWIASITGFSLENYETKGSVSHLALLAACNMGCNPIILTGQDLAYTDGKYYSDGSFWGKENETNKVFQRKLEKTKQHATVQVKGQNGEILQSSYHYAGFIKHFEEFAKEKKAKIKLINCSPGGAQINGFENINLEEIVGTLNLIDIEMHEYLDNIIHLETDPVKSNFSKIHEQLNLFLKDVKQAYFKSEKGCQTARKIEQESKKPYPNPVKVGQLVNSALGLFDELENKLFKKWDFSMYMIFKEIMEVYSVLDVEFTLNEREIIFELARTLKPLFETANNRLKTVDGYLSEFLNHHKIKQ